MITKEIENVDIESYLSQVRSRNERLHQDRLMEVYERLPRVEALDKEISGIGIREIKLRLQKKEGSKTYREDIDRLSTEKHRIMEEAGYPADYLEPIYSCPLCKDSGVYNNESCKCVRKLMIDELYKRSNLHNLLKKENFNTFNLDYYSKEIPEGRKISPYDNEKRLLDMAKKFVDDFGPGSKGIFIYGGTGLGKTFLSNCIAKELLDKGKTVLYLSANELFEEVISKYILSKNPKDRISVESIYEYVYNSDLLIIDDLGTEVLSSFVLSQLFEIINKRILTERPTLISTNLDLGTVQDRYTKRITSRIVDNYTLYTVYGDDIRLIKARQ
ncbi:MAG: ATP-binding protein [Eubacterium sp.]|nr:ATP-binding protein [Eubacterium sp.]